MDSILAEIIKRVGQPHLKNFKEPVLLKEGTFLLIREFMDKIWIEEERCILCELCIPVCLFGLLVKGDKSITVHEAEKCILCGHCKAVCPQDAPQLPSLNATEFEELYPLDDRILGGQLIGLMRSRRSIRMFRKVPVEKERLQQIIEAGRYAPTVLNRQQHQYVVVHSKEKIRKMRRLATEALNLQGERIEKAMQSNQEGEEPRTTQNRLRQSNTEEWYLKLWREMPGLLAQGVDRLLFHAPAAILIHVDPSESRYPHLEAGLAAMQMLLMAEALGLGTCLCGFLSTAVETSSELRSLLEIPDTHKIPIAFVVGVPNVQYLKRVSRNPARVQWL